MPTNIERAEALLHKVLRISAIRTDANVPFALMCSDLAICDYRVQRGAMWWTVRIGASPDDGSDVLTIAVSGMATEYATALDLALAEYAQRLTEAAQHRADWAEEEGEVA